MPEIVLIMTDLPAPLSPANAVTWPAGISRSTSVSACTGPKCLLTPRRRRSGTSSSPAGPVGAVLSVAVVMLSASSRCSITPVRGWVASHDPTTYRALLLEPWYLIPAMPPERPFRPSAFSFCGSADDHVCPTHIFDCRQPRALQLARQCVHRWPSANNSSTPAVGFAATYSNGSAISF